MPTAGHLAAFSAAAFVLIVIPGPSVLFSIGRAIAYGRTAGLVSVAGNTLGTFGLICAVAFGIGSLIAASTVAFTVIKVVGVAYLLYLGVTAIRDRKHGHVSVAADGRRTSLPTVFRQAMLVGATNPKSLAFFVAVLPQFVDQSHGSATTQILVFGVVFAIIAFCSDGIWALAAGSARDWFAHSPHRAERLAATGGGLMIALAGVLAFARRASA
ncbi:LysE family translocator [Nocardioides sp. Kera G14]|uniref:LysE family translocator n=1 Tax=Nocardioides sp. Kera G14 TaxID=2884264 RepID=UPI001D119C3A|nr:LysE family translocator [Nocardioides sp. Kera G14]UDY22887.1 LysE family translocator [Nocardioides sp. Kera G14]